MQPTLINEPHGSSMMCVKWKIGRSVTFLALFVHHFAAFAQVQPQSDPLCAEIERLAVYAADDFRALIVGEPAQITSKSLPHKILTSQFQNCKIWVEKPEAFAKRRLSCDIVPETFQKPKYTVSISDSATLEKRLVATAERLRACYGKEFYKDRVTGLIDDDSTFLQWSWARRITIVGSRSFGVEVRLTGQFPEPGAVMDGTENGFWVDVDLLRAVPR